MLWFWVLLKTESSYAGQTELPSNKARENAGNRRWGRACFLLDVLGRLCLQTQGWVGWTAASPGPSVPAHQYLEAGVQWAHSLARLGDSPQMLIAPWEGTCSERPSAGYCSDPTSWAPFTCFNSFAKSFTSSYTPALKSVTKIWLWNAARWNSLPGVVVEHPRVTYAPYIKTISHSVLNLFYGFAC